MRQTVKLSDVKAGDTLQADDGFTCMLSGPKVVKEDETGRLFIECSEGQHFLDGQFDLNNKETLIGLYK